MSNEYNKAPFILKLVSMCISSAETAGKIIRDVVKKGDLKLVNKGDDEKYDPQTEADRQSQLCILGKLNQCFPNLKIIAEEGEIEGLASSNLLDSITPKESVFKITVPSELLAYNENNLIVWIDPLDGTNGFSKGRYYQVTVLIGIATYDGKPIAGIIHQPYHCDVSLSHDFQTFDYSKSAMRTIWGIVGVGIFGLESKERFREADSVAVISHSHATSKDWLKANALRVDKIISVSGAAFKGLSVLENQADVVLYSSGGTKKWDTCAMDALFIIVGGKVTNILGESLEYGPDAVHDNTLGVIATLKNHDLYIKRIEDNTLE